MVSTRSASSSVTPRVTPPVTTPSTTVSTTRLSRTSKKSYPSIFSHTPSTATLAWLAISLPLVAWDTGYILLRPHSMPGGKYHKPIWGPYELYGKVDYVYGWKAWDGNNGFTAAQGTMNVVETVMYCVYLYIWSTYGVVEKEGTRASVQGRPAASALLILFSALVMTIAKTSLYWLNEYWSSFDNIGHNSWMELIPLWIIPNGAWLVVPTYLVYQTTFEILDAMAPSGPAVKSEKSDD